MLTAGWLSPLRSAARVTLRSAINASNTTKRLRSTVRKFRSAMTSMFLCHFPGGAPSGIIAACTDTRLRAAKSGPAIANPALAACREVPVFDEHDQ